MTLKFDQIAVPNWVTAMMLAKNRFTMEQQKILIQCTRDPV